MIEAVKRAALRQVDPRWGTLDRATEPIFIMDYLARLVGEAAAGASGNLDEFCEHVREEVEREATR